jgi:hypothetical protein
MLVGGLCFLASYAGEAGASVTSGTAEAASRASIERAPGQAKPAESKPAEQKTRVGEMIICKSPGRIVGMEGSEAQGKTVGRAVRTLRLYDNVTDENGVLGCRATYSKTNIEQTVGSGRNRGHCQGILSGIQKNLENSHWVCRKAGGVSVLKSNTIPSGGGSGQPSVIR